MMIIVYEIDLYIRSYSPSADRAFGGQTGPGMIRQNVSHQLCGDAKKVRTVLPPRSLFVD
jgi:hypothetical protein